MQIYLAVAPRDYIKAGEHSANLAMMAYKIDPAGKLKSLPLNINSRGGIMVVDDSGCTAVGLDKTLPDQITKECIQRGYQGVLLDFENLKPAEVRDVLAALAMQLMAKKVTLYAAAEFADCSPVIGVVVSGAVSGGSYREYLAEQCAKHGAGRIALDLERVCTDFIMPSQDGAGKNLSPEEFAQISGAQLPFYSKELCANYFSHRASDGTAHFVLFDDANTLKEKLNVAQGLGINTAIMLYPEVLDIIDSFDLI